MHISPIYMKLLLQDFSIEKVIFQVKKPKLSMHY